MPSHFHMVPQSFWSPRQRVSRRGGQRRDNCGGENHHYDSAKAAIGEATKDPPITHEQCRIYGKRGEKVNHKLESLQLSRKDQVSISRLRSCHHPDLTYWLHKLVGLQLSRKDQVSISRLRSGHHPDLK